MSILTGKSMAVLGDSLIQGNEHPKDITWPNLLGKKHGMTVYNHGLNGNTIAMVDNNGQLPMCRRYLEMEDGVDYVVVAGGSNDRGKNIPLGELDSKDETTFIGALRILIEGVLEKYPRARILFMTNYNRRFGPNDIGLCDRDYAEAMERVCEDYAIPCFNNYKYSGLSWQNPSQVIWMDEGMCSGYEDRNWHFSPEAYIWLAQRYESVLVRL